ncbi:F0F1 ATP synthase subunit gamma [Ignatzschineria cameli]|uniref:ATP synthase gamma chain n=1 Tax=Ignatzschineria cameli TaxID=2182793 RepID=A0A2U2AR24_9GAMM|nr:F0F1 ATP synthase subunit gamma [Ignatzschineria cameli]PWD85262.1 F0F1 ATP synthase subunit gamma [Ignatzschineria cameli]PWD86313.1 F0F1 ATP synthase subunit gamma [Ignatzschineria cameli]PWD89849.1 F0F1 ATP synthase subunit gamma [Ignatzschineria cameli]PWD91499.1 F0F1 ATP synthase subunit gamma [Ignatzschineria cameli]PWD92537.1 F0F1 ATP synthase subunit gamma [Ignatzschineria cameli]
MAVGKEIRSKIKSISNTQKITSAMEMVAASKMRATQLRRNRSLPYAQQVIKLAAHLAEATPEEFKHEYLIPREVKRVGVIVVSSDRGLAGGLNNNLFKLVVTKMKEWREAGIEMEVATIGNKANAFFGRFGHDLVATVNNLGDAPASKDLIGITTAMLDLFQEGKIDELHVFANEFVNTMTQKPIGIQVLPVVPGTLQRQIGIESVAQESNLAWDYVYDSEPVELMNTVLDRYIESVIFQAVVENVACEMAARMIAMKAASDNASDLIDELQLVYNKARQAAITQEITEIVSGAAAIN